MRLCPTCQRRYSDETLNFCLEDGAPLSGVADTGPGETLTLDASEPPPTEILYPGLAPTLRAQRPPLTVPQEARPTRDEIQNLSAPAGARKTSSVVALTVVATLLLVGLGGLGAWLFLKGKNGEANTNEAGSNSARGSNSNIAVTGSPRDSTGGNSGEQPVVVSSPTPYSTPLATPTPRPTPQITDASGVQREVSNALEGWRRTMINPDVDAHMSYYAGVLHTYYNAKSVAVSRVRANVARAFSSYSTFNVQITNLQIEVDPSGEKASATFVKTFEFSRSDKRYAGSGLNRFWFEKIGDRWLITGEKDLETH